jgi:hypothetical protein
MADNDYTWWYETYSNAALDEITERLEEEDEDTVRPSREGLTEMVKHACRLYADDEIRAQCWQEAIAKAMGKVKVATV